MPELPTESHGIYHCPIPDCGFACPFSEDYTFEALLHIEEHKILALHAMSRQAPPTRALHEWFARFGIIAAEATLFMHEADEQGIELASMSAEYFQEHFGLPLVELVGALDAPGRGAL